MTLRAKAGTTITFFATVYQDGTPTNPDAAGDVNVYDAATGGSIVTAGSALTPTAVGSGVYSVAWPIDAGQAAGTYYPEWDFTEGGLSPTVRSELTVLGAGTTVKELVLLGIKSALESITTANGYKTAVAAVETGLRSRDEVTKRPHIGFGIDRESVEHYAFGTMRVTMPWTVVGYVEAAVGDDWTDAIGDMGDLRDDIIAAVLEDDTLGGNCVFTVQVDDLDDSADPNRRDIASDGGAVVVNFKTVFNRDTGSS